MWLATSQLRVQLTCPSKIKHKLWTRSCSSSYTSKNEIVSMSSLTSRSNLTYWLASLTPSSQELKLPDAKLTWSSDLPRLSRTPRSWSRRWTLLMTQTTKFWMKPNLVFVKTHLRWTDSICWSKLLRFWSAKKINFCSWISQAAPSLRNGWELTLTVHTLQSKWLSLSLKFWSSCLSSLNTCRSVISQEPCRSTLVTNPRWASASRSKQPTCCKDGRSLFTTCRMSMTRRVFTSFSKENWSGNSKCLLRWDLQLHDCRREETRVRLVVSARTTNLSGSRLMECLLCTSPTLTFWRSRCLQLKNPTSSGKKSRNRKQLKMRSLKPSWLRRSSQNANLSEINLVWKYF